jgi:hypothetical protein
MRRTVFFLPSVACLAVVAVGCGQKEKPLGRTDFPSSFAPGAPKPGQNTPPPTTPPPGMMTGPGMVPSGQGQGGVPTGAPGSGVPMGAPGSGSPINGGSSK